MNAIKIVHCADLHLGAPLSSLSEKADSRRGEYLLTFERIVELCRNEAADLLLIAGDLFDSTSVDSALVKRVFSLMETIPDTTVIAVAGNHDPLTADSPYRLVEQPFNFRIFSDKMGVIDLAEKNTRVYGISFGGSEFTSKIKIGSADDDTVNILLLHADLDADMSSRYNPLKKSDITSANMDYVALGHIHKRTEPEKINGTTFAYPGCPEPSGFDELGEKGVYVGTVSKKSADMRFVPLSLRRFEEVNIDVSSLSSSAEIAEKTLNILEDLYGEEYRENFYKIILTGTTEEPFVPDLEYIRTVLADRLYFVKVKGKTTFNIDYGVLSREFTLKGIFTRRMLEKIESAEGDDKVRLENALHLGLTAFDTEVKSYEV